MIAFLLLMSCGTRKIMGQVQDIYQMPIGEVSIQVDSDSNGSTDQAGQYVIESPLKSQFSIAYLKQGYAPIQVELKCPRRRCQAPTVNLTPIDLTVPYQPELLLPLVQPKTTDSTGSLKE